MVPTPKFELLSANLVAEKTPGAALLTALLSVSVTFVKFASAVVLGGVTKLIDVKLAMFDSTRLPDMLDTFIKDDDPVNALV